MDEVRVMLIGGTSHTGKSTLAQSLAQQLSWEHLSTDRLARHPGRPWKTTQKTVPPHVADHYASLSVDALLADVLRHYKNIWPTIEDVISLHRTRHSARGLVLEGSALWPELVATLPKKNTRVIWLTASEGFLRRRVYSSSHFDKATDQEKLLIEKFLERTLLYNQRLLELVDQQGLNCINVENMSSLDGLSTACLDVLEK